MFRGPWRLWPGPARQTAIIYCNPPGEGAHSCKQRMRIYLPPLQPTTGCDTTVVTTVQ